MVVKTNEGNIETDIFYKKTNAHRYPYFESAHPRKTKRNIPFTLAQRITRIISNPTQQEQRLQELIEFLIDCHYPKELAETAITRAKELPKSNIDITGLEHETIAFVTTYIPSISVDENYTRKRIE